MLQGCAAVSDRICLCHVVTTTPVECLNIVTKYAPSLLWNALIRQKNLDSGVIVIVGNTLGKIFLALAANIAKHIINTDMPAIPLLIPNKSD
mgnify:FL=1